MREDELSGSVEAMYRFRSPEIQKKIAKHRRELAAMLKELEEMEGENSMLNKIKRFLAAWFELIITIFAIITAILIPAYAAWRLAEWLFG